MVEGRSILVRTMAWIVWGALAALGYAIGAPLILGGAALFPVAVVAYEGVLVEALIAIAAAVLGVALMQQQLSLPALAVFAAGALLGRALRRDGVLAPWLVAVTLVVLAGWIGVLFLPSNLGGAALPSSGSEARVISQMLAMPANQARQLAGQLIAQIPGLVPIYAGIVTLEAFYFTRWALRARGKQLTEVPAFSQWQAPAWLAPLYLALLGLQVILSLSSAPGTAQLWIGYAALWGQVPLAVFGLAVASFWMTRMRLPLVVRVISLVLLMITPPFSQILVWVGVLDNVTDLRHIRNAST